MADYAAMYHTLFHSQTEAIELLQKAQQKAEELYISAPETEIKLFDSGERDGEEWHVFVI